MKTVRSIGGLYGRPQGNEKGNLFISQHSPTICEHNRPRTRSTVTIWHLPDSVLVNLFKGIHIKDLLSLRSVHPQFQNIINSNRILWTTASFAQAWPSDVNTCHFIRASNHGNIEATIKLAVSYLYREALTKEDVVEFGQEAAEYLCKAEALTPNTFPFFWIFIRPPWATEGSCCKVEAFQCIKELVDGAGNKDLAFGVALTMKLQRLSLNGIDKEDEKKYFKVAMDQKSAPAIFFSLLDAITDETDTFKELERIRLLRQLASSNILEARLNLVKGYIRGHYGGVSEVTAREYAQDFFASSKPSKIHMVFSESLTSDMSRYIVVDWLVEVVGMKDFSAHTLYLAVSMFDRFLQIRNVQRSQVQLLGVAAMVISSRFLGFDILTIREAAWLTDNSYSYHDVVKMMGELVAAVKGNIRVLTIQDYVKVLIAMSGESGYVAMLVEYIAMLCLLQSEMGQYSPAEIAASCLLLSRLLMNKDNPWPEELKGWTGFSQEYLGLCTFHIHKKCLLEGAEVDYRDTKLQAVKMRYADSNRFSVSNIEIIGHRELCRRLGVTQLISHGKNTKAIRFRNTDELIVSPRRGRRKSLQSSSHGDDFVDRNSAATPPIKAAYVFEEGVSGYEGDLEEEDSDESLSDKSDIFFDLNESYLSDPSEDSHEWDSEQSLIGDQSMDEGSADLESNTSGLDSFLGIKESNLACLSSLCQFGNNVSCLALGYSPSRCISNCSCQQSNVSTGSSLCAACPRVDSGKSLSSPASNPASSLLSPSSSSQLSHSAKEHPFRALDNSSVSSRHNILSSDIAKSSSACDTRDTIHHKDCDVHCNGSFQMDHLHSLPSHHRIKTSGFNGPCNMPVSANQPVPSVNDSDASSCYIELAFKGVDLTSDSAPDLDVTHFPAQKVIAGQPMCCLNEIASSSNAVTFPRKSRRLTSTPKNKFTRLPLDDRINLTQHNSSFLSSTPCNSFISKYSHGCINQACSEIQVPFSDKLLHNHFTRSNSAFKIASSLSIAQSGRFSQDQHINQSKKSKLESCLCHSSTDKDEEVRCSVNRNVVVPQCDMPGDSMQCVLLTKRKRKL